MKVEEFALPKAIGSRGHHERLRLQPQRLLLPRRRSSDFRAAPQSRTAISTRRRSYLARLLLHLPKAHKTARRAFGRIWATTFKAPCSDHHSRSTRRSNARAIPQVSPADGLGLPQPPPNACSIFVLSLLHPRRRLQAVCGCLVPRFRSLEFTGGDQLTHRYEQVCERSTYEHHRRLSLWRHPLPGGGRGADALCRCTDCRRHAGAPMVGWTMYRLDAVKVTKGATKVYESLETPADGFSVPMWHRPFLHERGNPAGHHRH